MLLALQRRINSPEFLQRHRASPAAFTRERTLGFRTVVLVLLNLLKGSLQDELDGFFQALRGGAIATRVVTKSAFSQARRKLRPGAFVELNALITTFFYAHARAQQWHGLRLLAIDGTTARLPRTAAMAAHFGGLPGKRGGFCPLARVSQLYDVLNRITVAATIAPYAVGERALATAQLDGLTSTDLLLLDRGYPGFWFFSLVTQRGLQFCARVTTGYTPAVRDFVASGDAERSIQMTPGLDGRQLCRTHGVPPTPIAVRLVRVELDGAEPEILLTSLCNASTYPHRLFRDLYHRRWTIEEHFKTCKCRVEIENFTGKSVAAVYQDFQAKVVTTNLTAVFAHVAQHDVLTRAGARRHPYRVNFSHALSRMKDTVIVLLTRCHRRSLVAQLLDVLCRTLEPVRPGRRYPRHFDDDKLQGFYPTYKRTR